jgi:hypothetical protein
MHTLTANAANDRPQVSNPPTLLMACARPRHFAWRLIPGDNSGDTLRLLLLVYTKVLIG